MNEGIKTIIVNTSRHTRELIQLYLNEYGQYDFLAAVDDYLQVHSTLKTLPKALIIVDMSKDTDKALSFISTIATDYPHCAIIAMSEKPDIDLAVKVMCNGEFVALPLIKTEFFAALAKIQEGKKKNKSRVITVYSNKGGIGKTSIASNMALELAKITKENVALVDLNFQMGDVATFMDIKPAFTLSYLLENQVSSEFLLNSAERYKKTSLYILADPAVFKQMQEVSRKQLSQLFDILRETFSYIIVDTSAGLDNRAISVLDNSDLVLRTTIVNLPALRNCQKCLELFDNLGYPAKKIKVLLNRFMENDEITEQDVEELLDREIYWKIPNNYFTMMASINKGIPVSEISPDSNVAQSYKELAMRVTESIYKYDKEPLSGGK
jgi:pilus assembly protein CpaE